MTNDRKDTRPAMVRRDSANLNITRLRAEIEERKIALALCERLRDEAQAEIDKALAALDRAANERTNRDSDITRTARHMAEAGW